MSEPSRGTDEIHKFQADVSKRKFPSGCFRAEASEPRAEVSERKFPSRCFRAEVSETKIPWSNLSDKKELYMQRIQQAKSQISLQVRRFLVS